MSNRLWPASTVRSALTHATLRLLPWLIAAYQPVAVMASPATLQLQGAVASTSTSFEEFESGEFTRIETSVGLWIAQPGHAEIDAAHRRTGQRCLHLLGGEQRSVELTLKHREPASQLCFYAERWTRRAPFDFRVEQSRDGVRWKEVYKGDDVIRVGGFLTKVTIPLKDNPSRLRLTCTSPVNSGVLIDDLSFVPLTAQQIVGISVEDVEVPVLVGLQQSPLLRIRVDTQGTEQPVSLKSVKVRLTGTIGQGDLASVQILGTGDATTLRARTIRFGEGTAGKDGTHRFAGSHALQHGSNYFWLCCALSSEADVDRVIDVRCDELQFSGGAKAAVQGVSLHRRGQILSFKPALNDKAKTHRLGVAVRQQGQDGVHTSRIPGLATTNRGTLIGVYDLRRRGGGDLPGDIDVGMSRSTDGGRTWEPTRVIMDMGDDPDWRYDGIGDPAVLVDQNTGTLWVAATWSHGDRSWRGSGPGLKPAETGQLMLVRSDDDGVTWSMPVNITAQVKKPEWCFLLQGPGKGITLRDGSIVFAAQYQDPPEKKRLPHSTIIYSSDHGETWQIGTGAFDDTTEAQVVEVEPGELMLNCRYNRQSTRVVMTTRDMGRTWQAHPTSQRSLIEPRACMASLINVDRELRKDAGGWLLFSNPDSTTGRDHITVKASNDNGRTWPKQYRLLLDEGVGAGYSCMTMVDDQTVGILYEGSLAHMTFQRIPLSEVIGRNSPERARVKPSAGSSLELPSVFGDHMVLQSDIAIPVWGHARPGEQVTVSLGRERFTTTSDAYGNWMVRFPPRRANANPTVLRVCCDGDEVTINDVLVGEVWVCAGQSNMEWPLSGSANSQAEIAKADQPQIRLLHLAGGARGGPGSYTETHISRLTADKFCEGAWTVANPKWATSFSAVGWYFGRYLHDQLKVPIGLISPATGGTPTEAWMRRSALASDPTLKGLVQGNWLDNERMGDFCRRRGTENLLRAIQAGDHVPGDDLGPNHSFKPAFMWQAGIAPLIPYAIRGVIWYQGESNAESLRRASEHARLFPLLVNDWRSQWEQGDFPFLYVQLPGMMRPDWPCFRDGQRRILDQLDNVGMAVTIDTGHPTNVHPTAKQPVGERLARWALGTTYKSKEDAVCSGPLFRRIGLKHDSIVLHFTHVGTGLASSDGQPLRHFEVAGPDGVFLPAAARIVGQTIVLSSESVATPRHARYAWVPYAQPPVNFFNREGLPASPFTTQSTPEN